MSDSAAPESQVENAEQLALHNPGRWRTTALGRATGCAGGVAAVRMRAAPGEVWGPASSAHILGYVVHGEPHHHHWRDDRLAFQGSLRDGSLNLVPLGVAPRAVVTRGVEMVHVFLPHVDLVLRAREHGFVSTTGIELRDVSGEPPDPALAMLMQTVGNALTEESSSERLWLESLINALCIRLLAKWSNAAPRPPQHPVRGLPAAQVRRVCEAMASAVDDGRAEPTLRDLARLVALSPNHFCRAFAQAVGVPPYVWLASYRIDRAKALLRNSTTTLMQVALSVGYENQSSFGRAFRRIVGMSPATWRRMALS